MLIKDERVEKILNAKYYDTDKAKGTISATMLENDLRFIGLSLLHKDIKETGYDRIWSVFGSAMHELMDKSSDVQNKEVRLKHTIKKVTISGKYDFIEDEYLCDYKVTKAWSYRFNPHGDAKWAIQLSIYRWLYFKSTGKLLKNTGKIYIIFRDWDEKKVKPAPLGVKKRATHLGPYPDAPVGMIEMPLSSIDEVQQEMEIKVQNITQMMDGDIENIPACENTWKNDLKCKRYCRVKEFCSKRKGG